MNTIVILCDTLRRDHCGPYHLGRRLDECGSPYQPDWVVPTPNMDRLAERGVVFDNAFCGSTPCMPARRDIYTGRYEFLWRGWGPLEEDDLDLPRQVSGEPNRSLRPLIRERLPISYLITDHFHLWEQGAGNYHMGYSGFEFIRGHESDAWHTDPVDFFCPRANVETKHERHFRNIHFSRKGEEDWFCAQVFRRAADWVERNRDHAGFFLHLDCFDPHEPWDPPEQYVRMFDPRGYDVPEWRATAPYRPWAEEMDEGELLHLRARYAAMVVLVDRWLGVLLDKLDELGLWDSTTVILTSDHGTYNGDHGRMGKLQTHEFPSVGHIPFIVRHPEGRAARREQLVQLVDIYPTVLETLGRRVPEGRHGVSLLPALGDPSATTRRHALCGQFGKSVTITDGRWTLHQAPVAGNRPLYWYSPCLSRFMGGYELGPYAEARREVRTEGWDEETWLSDRTVDPYEHANLAARSPDRVLAMKRELRDALVSLAAPDEQLDRLGLRHLPT